MAVFADKVERAAEPSWDLWEDSGSVGSAGAEADGFHVFPGTSLSFLIWFARCLISSGYKWYHFGLYDNYNYRYLLHHISWSAQLHCQLAWSLTTPFCYLLSASGSASSQADNRRHVTRFLPVVGPLTWNDLLENISFAESIFCQELKTHSFTKLEIWGKAERESTRHPKFDWGKYLGGWNSTSSKVMWPELQFISIHKTHIVDLGYINIRACNFFVGGPKFTNFSLLNPTRITLNYFCFLFSTLQSVLKIFTVKVESCLKSDRIFEFLALQNFWAAGPPKICI